MFSDPSEGFTHLSKVSLVALVLVLLASANARI